MKKNALFYPYINLPEKEQWLIQNLLYWDKLNSIVPTQFNHDESNLTDTMIELKNKELVNFIHPMDYLNEIPNFKKDIINKAEKFIEKKYFKENSSYNSRIHIEKLGTIKDDLLSLKLIKEDPKLTHPWLYMEDKFANIFMRKLANELCTIEKLDSTPITNINRNKKKLLKINDKFVSFNMPLPKSNISLDKISEFKEKHFKDAYNYRLRIEKAIYNVLGQKKKHQKDCFEHEKKLLNKEKEDLSEKMGEIIQEKVKDKLIIPVITTALISIIDPLSGLVSGIGYTSQIIKKNSKVSSPLEYITAIERTNFLK